nr:phosphodiester glycosidase family protein [Brevibacillus halotolerans]
MLLVLSRLNLFFVLLLAPLCGILLAFAKPSPLEANMDKLSLKSAQLAAQMSELEKASTETKDILASLRKTADQDKKEAEHYQKQLDNLVAASKNQTKQSTGLLDEILANLLGDPIGQNFGKNSRIKVYSLKEAGYSGYMAKVHLFNPNALKMVLANDSVYSRGETTSHAAKRKGAVLAVNAGGFDKRNGKLAPLGITVVDGQVKTFSNNPNLSFVGFNKNGRLHSGRLTSQEQVKKNGIMQGASFLPILLENGQKKAIPKAWANRREPRTLIGNFENGDLLFIVIDGRNKGGSKGVTLEEAQRKLLEFKVRDAYNLDGGSSSVFYYNGKVLNHPSSGRELSLTTHLVVLP